MMQVNILDAKTNLSKLIATLEDGEHEYITIARSGKPVAQLILYDEKPCKRIGAAKGLFEYNEAFDEYDDYIKDMFEGGNRQTSACAGKA